MASFFQDLRYAARTLLKSPGFTVVAVLTLALGIGANVAIFSVVYGVLLRQLPFAHPEQLVRIFDDLAGPNTPDVGMSAPELWDLEERSGVFQEVSAMAPGNSAVGGGERTVRAESLITSPDYFQLLGVFAAVALLLAAIGIYGVMSYAFSQRTHEVGIRMALGAQRLDILRMALVEGMRIVVIGLVVGLAGAAVITRFFQSMLFNVAPSDPVTFLMASAMLAGVAFLGIIYLTPFLLFAKI